MKEEYPDEFNELVRRLCTLMDLHKDKRYRRGMLQAAVSFGIITQRHWVELMKLYMAKPQK